MATPLRTCRSGRPLTSFPFPSRRPDAPDLLVRGCNKANLFHNRNILLSSTVMRSTHQAITTLEDAGATPDLARAVVEIVEAATQGVAEGLVTKVDLEATEADLELRIKELELRLTLRLGGITVVTAGLLLAGVQVLG